MARHRKKQTVEPELTVLFTCKWCGRPIEVGILAGVPEIPDVQSFLALHAQCLDEVRRDIPPD